MHRLPDVMVKSGAADFPDIDVVGETQDIKLLVALRAVSSTDGMRADFYPFDMQFIGHVARRIINEAKGVNRVVYDVTSKPPGTIEWE
jgi:GMP synthase (glutamine-hydrolysing)